MVADGTGRGALDGTGSRGDGMAVADCVGSCGDTSGIGQAHLLCSG